MDNILGKLIEAQAEKLRLDRMIDDIRQRSGMLEIEQNIQELEDENLKHASRCIKECMTGMADARDKAISFCKCFSGTKEDLLKSYILSMIMSMHMGLQQSIEFEKEIEAELTAEKTT